MCVVPAKHRVNCFRNLCATVLVDAARVDPDVLKAVLRSLLRAEGKLVTTTFLFACARKHVLVDNFLIIWTSGMRENGIGRNIVALKLDKAEATATLELQKTHREGTVCVA